MFAQVVMRNPDPPPVFILVFNLFLIGLTLWLAYLLVRSFLWGSRQKRALKYMRQATALGKKQSQWLKDHYSDLERNPVFTLCHPEFVSIMEEDQGLYEKISSVDPGYAKVVIPPKDLHQKLIDLAASKNPKP